MPCQAEKEKIESEKNMNTLAKSFGFGDPAYIQVLGLLCDIYLRGYIVNKKDLVDTVKAIGEPFTTWLIDLDGFDYSRFNVEWINRCYMPLLKRISSNDKAREGISKKIAEEYAQGHIDNRIMKKYFRFFANHMDETDMFAN